MRLIQKLRSQKLLRRSAIVITVLGYFLGTLGISFVIGTSQVIAACGGNKQTSEAWGLPRYNYSTITGANLYRNYPYFRYLGYYGGVTLNQAATFLADMNDIRGSYYDQAHDRIVFVGRTNTSLPKFDKDDLAVAIRAIAFNGTDPAVSMDFSNGDRNSPTQVVSYYGGINNTKFGNVLAQADYQLKKYALGYNESQGVVTSSVPGYKSHFDRFLAQNPDVSESSAASRFWISPKTMTLKKDDATNSFVFDQAKMQVEFAPLYAYNAPKWDQAGRDFAQQMTDAYDSYANENSWFSQTKQLAKIVSVVKWIKDNGIATDYTWARNYTPINTPSPQTFPTIVTPQKTAANGVRWWLRGGVVYYTPNTYTAANGTASSLKTASEAVNAPREQAHWTFSENGTTYDSVAVGASAFRTLGAFNTSSNDMNIATQGDYKLGFNRTYSSFSNDVTAIGRGWDFRYAQLIDMRPGVVMGCSPPAGAYQGQYPVQLALRTQDGVYETFSYDCATGQYKPDKPEYHSVLTRSADGWWSAKLKNQTELRFTSANRDFYRMIDRNSQAINYVSDPNNGYRISSIETDLGYKLSIGYNAQNLISSVTDWTGRVTTYTYDGNQNLTAVTDPRGGVTRYGYDANNKLTTVTDPTGQVAVTNSYTPESKLATQTEAGAPKQTFGYDLATKTMTITDANGRIKKVTYDDKARVVQEVEPGGAITKREYGNEFNPTATVDAKNNRTTYAYDANGNVTTITDPSGGRVVYIYDAQNHPTKVTDYRYGATTPKVTTLSYDTRGNLVSKNDAGKTTSFTYNAQGGVMSTTNANGQRSEYDRDAMGNITVADDPFGHSTNYAYDGLGRKTKVTDSNGKVTTYTYDANGNVLTQSNSAGTTVNTYDASNHLTSIKLPDGSITTYTYTPSGKINNVTDPLGGVTQYGYDGYKNLTSKKDALNNLTSYSYTVANKQSKLTTPLGKATNWEYDQNGNLTKRTDANSKVTSYSYDALDRLTTAILPDATTVAYSYDARDNLTKLVSSAGTVTYGYDTFNRLTSVTDVLGKTISYSYDNLDKLTKVTYPDGKAVNYSYDGREMLTVVKDWNNASTIYSYNSNGSLSQTQLPNGINSNYAYDEANRLFNLSHIKNGINQASFTYTRDGNGRVVQALENRSKMSLIYDETLSGGWTSAVSGSTADLLNANSYSGVKAIAWTPTAGAGTLTLRSSAAVNTTPFKSLTFAMRASSTGQSAKVQLVDTVGAAIGTAQPVATYGEALSKNYVFYTVPLSALSGTNRQIGGVLFNNPLTTSQAVMYIDSISLSDANQPVKPSKFIYDDGLNTGWQSWSWDATLNFGSTAKNYTGTKAISWVENLEGSALSLWNATAIDKTNYSAISFAIAGTADNQEWGFRMINANGDDVGTEIYLNELGGATVNGTYKVYTIPFSALNLGTNNANGFWLQSWTPGKQTGTFYVDAIQLIPNTTANPAEKVTYSYDKQGQIISATTAGGVTTAYSYDKAGNRLTETKNGTTKTSVYNADNQATSVGGVTQTYDNNGNLLTNGTKTYTYDFENRLKTFSDSSTGKTVTYDYDGAGERVRKTVNGTKTEFVNDLSSELSKVLMTRDGSGAGQDYYLYGAGLLSQGSATAQSRQYVLSDGLGNPRIIDDAQGNVLGVLSFDAYGNASEDTPSRNKFQNEQQDSESNMLYLRARYYDPSSGRFISKDPVSGTVNSPQTQNGYNYANNDPVNGSDPSGEFLETLWDIGFILYDIGNCEWGNLLIDGGSTLIPFLPAGAGHLKDVGRVAGHLDDISDAGKAASRGARFFKGSSAAADAFKHLERYNGLNPHDASFRLHKMKSLYGLGGADNVLIDYSGGVYIEKSGQYLGSLLDKAW